MRYESSEVRKGRERLARSFVDLSCVRVGFGVGFVGSKSVRDFEELFVAARFRRVEAIEILYGFFRSGKVLRANCGLSFVCVFVADPLDLEPKRRVLEPFVEFDVKDAHFVLLVVFVFDFDRRRWRLISVREFVGDVRFELGDVEHGMDSSKIVGHLDRERLRTRLRDDLERA